MRSFNLKLLVVSLILLTILPTFVQAADQVGVFDNGQWAVGNNPATAKVFGFGWSGTNPIVGDWNGDGKNDVGIYNPSGNNFLIKDTNGYKVIGLGWAGVTPVVGDFDGDGDDDVGVYDNKGTWAFNTEAGIRIVGFGWSGTNPIVGDWNGDNIDEVGVYNPSGNNFLIQNGANYNVIGLGWRGVKPIVGDWNGDNKEDVGVYDSSSGQWAVGNNPATAKVFGFGWSGTNPIVGDWNGDNIDEVGVYNPSGNNFLIQNGANYNVIGLGWRGVKPIVGDWANAISSPAAPIVPTTPTVPAAPIVPTTPTVPVTPIVPTTPTVPTTNVGTVEIIDVDLEGETVTIKNVSPSPVNMNGWKLTDDSNKHNYVFPSFSFNSGSSVIIHLNKGSNSATDLYWGKDDNAHVWNDDGDTAYLYDSTGKLISTKILK